jgi:hypothetical protein
MLQDSLSIPLSIPPRLRLDKRFAPCAIESNHEFFANGIFEFNITRILESLDSNSVRVLCEVLEWQGEGDRAAAAERFGAV